MKRVYIAFYDGRVAAVFDSSKKCQSFVESRVQNDVEPFGWTIATLSEPRDPFGTKYEYVDERGNHHEWWSTDYEVA